MAWFLPTDIFHLQHRMAAAKASAGRNRDSLFRYSPLTVLPSRADGQAFELTLSMSENAHDPSSERFGRMTAFSAKPTYRCPELRKRSKHLQSDADNCDGEWPVWAATTIHGIQVQWCKLIIERTPVT